MQQNLNARAQKARKAVQADVLQKVEGGYRVPSRTQPYHHIVLARWVQLTTGQKALRLTCHYESSKSQWKCPGNKMGHICWHVLAAVMSAAAKKKNSVVFFEQCSEAERYAHLGGSLLPIISGDGPGMLWGVVKGGQNG